MFSVKVGQQQDRQRLTGLNLHEESWGIKDQWPKPDRGQGVIICQVSGIHNTCRKPDRNQNLLDKGVHFQDVLDSVSSTRLSFKYQ